MSRREDVARELGLPPDRVTPQVESGSSGEAGRSCASCGGNLASEDERLCESCRFAVERGWIEPPDHGEPVAGEEVPAESSSEAQSDRRSDERPTPRPSGPVTGGDDSGRPGPQAGALDGGGGEAGREPARTVNVHFDGPEPFEDFEERLDVELYETTESVWWLPDGGPEGLRGRRGMTFESAPSEDEAEAEPERDLFGTHRDPWRDEWRGMPAFEQEDRRPWKTVTLKFLTEEDAERFEREVLKPEDGKLYHGKWTWWPPRGYETWSDKVWVGGERETRYPVFVISKGRAETPLTVNALARMGVPHRVVVEPSEADAYRAGLPDLSELLVLPRDFSELGRGSIPVRNWVWAHALEEDSGRHWILDDNLDGFYRLHRNAKRLVADGAAIFRAAEDFTDRYRRVALSGLQYESFAMRREPMAPYRINTRIYSCILVRNDLPFWWRGRYNEDTDLSLRALKDGWRTILFNAFLANKVATMRMSGGNTDTVYAEDEGRREFAESLRRKHPDCVEVTRKWGRWHHQVDYSRFKRNPLRRREEAPGPADLPEVDEHGMELINAETGEVVEEAPEVDGRPGPQESVEEAEESAEDRLAELLGGAPAPEPEPDPEPGVGANVRVVEGRVTGGPSGPDLVPAEYRENDVWNRGVDAAQPEMFADALQDWRMEYRGMPEYRHEDQSPWGSVEVVLGGEARVAEEEDWALKVNFASEAHRDRFALEVAGFDEPWEMRDRVEFEDPERFERLVGQTITESTQSVWYPEAEIRRMSNKGFRVPGEGLEGAPGGRRAQAPDRAAERRPPIYIVSKGRWETRYTSDWLNEKGVAHFLVAEPEEAPEYRARVGPLTTVLELDMSYKERYDTCDEHGMSKPTGAGPARNFVWDHAAEELGADWHWVMDDNLQGFYRYEDNLKTPVGDGTVLRCMEDFVRRYENVAMAGPHYFMFVTRKTPGPPVTFNTRIYSCNLIRCDAPFRWRARWNEDTDLSLRMLKEGWATVLFSSFLQFKTPTMTMEGGNTDTVYAEDPTRRDFAEHLRDLHPDVTKVTRKWGRWHHHVDYGPFKSNRLGRREDVKPAELPTIDDYGMNLYVEEDE